MQDRRRIVGAPPGSVAVHSVASVAIRVDLDPYLTPKALAEYSGLSTRLLSDLLNDPLDPIPSYRIGGQTVRRKRQVKRKDGTVYVLEEEIEIGKVLVRRSEFDAWMARRRNRKPLAAAQLAAADAKALLGARRRG